MNTILDIKEVDNVILKNNKYKTFCGYKITTTQDNYYLLIEDGQQCCECWGYISSDEDLTKYIGKKLVSIDVIDDGYNKVMDILKEVYAEECLCVFINLRFEDMSELQFAVYNSHNGYYGHDVCFAKNKEILYEDCL